MWRGMWCGVECGVAWNVVWFGINVRDGQCLRWNDALSNVVE